jgi:AcrR family transcriptional regulator
MTPPTPRRKENPEATRQRILAAALELFNAQGTGSVSTNHIAEAAGLSVGNLYYHYKNKREVIRAIFQQNTADNLASFAIPVDRPLNLGDLDRMLIANFQTLWKYRFFYRELVAILNADEELAVTFRTFRQQGFANFTALVTAFSQVGVLRPILDPAEIDILAQNCWLISEFYLLYVESGHGAIDTISAHDWQASGLALLRQTLRPYLP